jgi:alpha-glucosidase
MTEAYASVEDTMAYYGNDTHPGAHFTFNFNFVSRPTSAQDFDNLVHQWVDNVPKGMQSNWVVSTTRGSIFNLLTCKQNYKH